MIELTVKEIAGKLGLEHAAGSMDAEVEGVYVGDLLSNVMAKAGEKNLWITVQGHPNVVAVAALSNLAGVVVVEDFPIQPEAVQRAREKNVNLLRTSMPAYELVAKLVELGV